MHKCKWQHLDADEHASGSDSNVHTRPDSDIYAYYDGDGDTKANNCISWSYLL
jgi:hypothetical protein